MQNGSINDNIRYTYRHSSCHYINYIFRTIWNFGAYLTFGLILSTHNRTKEIHSDLQIIKAKLGIEEKDEFNMTDQEIEEELEKEILIDNKKPELNSCCITI